MAGPTKGNEHWHMLTVVGADRPGIVAKLTEALFRGGCNLGEASMVLRAFLIDHLDGLLFLDRIVSPRHDLFRRKAYR